MLQTKNRTYRRLYVKPLATLGVLTLLAACSSDELPSKGGSDSTDGKTPIELTVGICGEGGSVSTHRAGGTTRSVVTNDKALNLAKKFDTGTSLYMVMKSEEDAVSPRADKYVRTIGYAQEEKDANNTNVKFATSPTDYRRFYEDTYSRKSLVSIYSACVPGYRLSGTEMVSDAVELTGTPGSAISINSSAVYSSNTWTETVPTTNITWPLHGISVANQTVANSFVASQDLCFSNNVSSAGSGRIQWSDSPRGFSAARMVFYHALTKVTFKIVKGVGFDSSEFTFSNDNENLVLEGFKTGGTFNIEQGEFTSTTTTTISELAKTGENTSATGEEPFYELQGLLVPGTDLDDDNPNISFTIGHNLYHLTKDMLLTALSGKVTSSTGTDALTAGNEMLPGVHYIFTLTVGKKEVDKLTAAVVGWETVTADNATPSNARIEVALLHNLTKLEGSASFDLYRKADEAGAIPANENAYASFEWTTGYASNKARLVETSSGVYQAYNSDVDPKAAPSDPDTYTPWYWPNNKTFYHFRAVMPAGLAVTTNVSGDYISLTGESIATYGTEYTGVCWGAPFKAKTADTTKPDNALEKVTYDKDTGFDNTQSPGAAEADHQISKAIGPTKGTIYLQLFHAMSDVTIQLDTSDGTDAVTLSGATLKLSNIYNSGLVRMGNGKVETTGAVSSPEIGGTVTLNDGKYKWRYAFIPQSLASVVLSITANSNLYEVNMADMVAETVGNNLIKNPYSTNGSGMYVIDRWYPNYKYIYTFKLTKTGISLISATLTDWEDVNAKEEEVQIK